MQDSPSPLFVRRVLVVVAVVVAVGAVLLFLSQAASVLLLFFAGIVLALFLGGLADLISKHTPLPRGWALGLVVLLMIGFFVGIGFLAGPSIGNQLDQLTQTIPTSVEGVKSRLEQYEWGQWLLTNTPPPEQMASSSPSSDIFGQITGFFSKALGGLANLLVILVVGLYLAIAPGLYVDGVLHLVPKRRRDRGRDVLVGIGHAVRRWLTGRIASMIVVGILTGLGLWVLGVPLALMLALLAGLLSFIPNLGPILSFVPAALVALMESPTLALYVAALYAGVQLVESYLITPLIQQKAVSLPPALLITVQILLGLWAGILGLLLATPLAVATIVAIQMLYVEDVLGDEIEVMGSAEAWAEEEGRAEGASGEKG